MSVSDEQVFFNTAGSFKKYPSNTYTFIQGLVTGVDTDKRIVRYTTRDRSEEVPFHGFIFCGFVVSLTSVSTATAKSMCTVHLRIMQ